MKIKLAYPKIPDSLECPLKQCVVFEKLDGTNLHWVFNEAMGWYAFGTRRDRFTFDDKGIAAFNQAHPELAEAIPLFKKSYQFLKPYKYSFVADDKEATIFTEFLGDKSFAGSHQKDDPKKLVMIDVSIIKDGKQYIVPPLQFLIDFGQFDFSKENKSGGKVEGFHLPEVVFHGQFSGQIFIDARKNKYKLNEGVIVKGLYKDVVYMAKIKTEAYLERLKNKFDDNWKDYWE